MTNETMINRFAAGMVVMLAGIATSCSNSLDPYPEAVFVVDTDMAVPRFVDTLRVDTFAADGTWVDSHDYTVVNPQDWPLSFGIYSKDTTKEATLYVRLRGYTTTRARDYRGERYSDATGTVPGPIPTKQTAQLPRLVANNVDLTPTSEPGPTTSIDRLVEVVLKPGVVGGVNIVLRGDCVGTMSKMSAAGSYHAFVPSEAATCLDTPNQLVPLTPVNFATKSTAPSVQGTWNPPAACNGTGGFATQCVQGGAFFLGSTDSVGWDLPSIPQRIVALSPFRMDTNEVTVGQWHAAVTKGLASPDETPWPFDQSFSTVSPDALVGCTYSTAPLDRENFPVSCVTFAAARAYCKFVGGDLPTEAQWEYAAAAAGRGTEAKYPWGDGAYPTCAQSVHGRGFPYGGGTHGTSDCSDAGIGPQPVNTSVAVGQDVTPLGLLNMAGSVAEWVLDTVSTYSDTCWALSGPKDPKCVSDGVPHVARGSYWDAQQSAVSDRYTTSNVGYYSSSLGFRCVYPAQ